MWGDRNEPDILNRAFYLFLPSPLPASLEQEIDKTRAQQQQGMESGESCSWFRFSGFHLCAFRNASGFHETQETDIT